ncbi:unnamed protein product [Spirodela intermedia]|uniref:Ubiquitin-like protease family profile domain-containing protein n=1 Tax=Spirodela intermedia TaxID=51605 RepID=A0A7I8K6E7_SPIIN|nr:unnamed protein product [Spirodela intermedia]
MVHPSGDDRILSFGDVVLRASDLEILRGPHYINDRIIEFCFKDIANDLPNDILLVPPSISFWIANCIGHESLKDAVGPLDLPSKKLVIFTINDNDDVAMAEGGQHWSLLVYDRAKDMFVHHDSMLGMNRPHAEQLYRRVKRFVDPTASFVEGSTPKQENGYDCGLYVVVIAGVIVRWHLQHAAASSDDEGYWISSVRSQVDGSTVNGMRKQILSRINQLRS